MGNALVPAHLMPDAEFLATVTRDRVKLRVALQAFAHGLHLGLVLIGCSPMLDQNADAAIRIG